MIVVGTLVLAFALFITAHVAITFGLAFRPPRWRAPAALLVAPLAPYWAWREHMRVRAGIWAGALVLYVVATIVSRF
jgi:hypothetical protein